MAGRKMDGGYRATEDVLRGIEARISKEYAIAEAEVQAKLDDYLRRFQKKDALKRKALANGLITQKDYDQWKMGQIIVGQRWSALRDSLAVDFANAAQNARQIAFGEMPRVYAINFNYSMYEADVLSGGKIAADFTLYSREAVAHLFQGGTFYHGPGRKLAAKIAMGKQVEWDKKQIQSVMMQGIIQGESIPNLATRLAETVGESDRKVAIRNARTMATGVQNAGRTDSIAHANSTAEKYGMRVLKQWCATLDGRARDWHVELDGEAIPEKDVFVNEYGEIEYPGDPGAEPANIYNCRCCLLPCIEGVGFNNSLHPKDTGRQMGKDIEGVSYEEWKQGHYPHHSDPITKQDDIAATMKAMYNNEYRAYSKLPDAGLGTGAGNDGQGFAPVHVGHVDINDRATIQSMLDDFDEFGLTQDIEHAVAILADGNVYYSAGTADHVRLAGLEDKLAGAIVTHNHPIKETHYSFGADDRTTFSNCGLAELYGADAKYKYVLSRTSKECDKWPGGLPTEEDLEHFYTIRYAQKYGFGYRRTKR